MKQGESIMNYKIIDKETYYRKGVYRHFTQDCKCSTSMTARIDVTALAAYSRQTGTKFYLNFLYILSKVLNSREDYRMAYLWQTDELICYDVIHPTQYVFHEDTETCTPVYTEYREDYDAFYRQALEDEEALNAEASEAPEAEYEVVATDESTAETLTEAVEAVEAAETAEAAEAAEAPEEAKE